MKLGETLWMMLQLMKNMYKYVSFQTVVQEFDVSTF